MKNLSYQIIIIFILVLSFSCKQENKKTTRVNLKISDQYLTIADTLIDDMFIKNTNNNEWTAYSLRKLDKQTLINQIFDLVYAGKLVPHEFFSDSVLTIDDIHNLENEDEFSRDKIAKVQFEESWYFDPAQLKMVKKVHSIMLAYEVYNNMDEIKGYKPAFKVYFK
jgi:hypothetical protein